MAPRTVRTTLHLATELSVTDGINTLDKVTEHGIEWDCQKVLRQYYNLIDHREFETAVELFTEDVTWRLRGLDLTGRDAILKALYAGSGSGDDTIRHIVNNIIVDEIDEDHAELRTYTTIYYSDEGRSEVMAKPVHLAGPQELNDTFAKMRRVGDDWKIAVRERGMHVFKRPD